MRRLALVTVLVLASVCCTLLVACGGEGCSAVGCGPKLTLQIRRPTWEPGTWTLALDSNLYCTWEVSGSGESAPAGCGGGDGPLVQLDAEPEEIVVSLRRDGTPIGSQVVRPAYRTSGDECLTCTSANEVVEF